MAATVAAAPRSNQDPGVASPRHRTWVIPLTAAVVMVLYAASAVLVARDQSGSDFHRRTAAAIAEGHLDIRPVPAELRTLPDPYDAGSNLDVRVDGDVQDLAYRDGRLYSAHGLTIPLLLVPSELAFGTSPPNWVITLVAACAGVAAAAWTLAQVRRRFLCDLPDWTTAAAVAAVGLCGPMWVVVSVGNGYEAAVAVGFALSMTGAALLLRSTERLGSTDPDRSLERARAAAGSAVLGLAVGARPTMVVTAILLAVIAAVVVARRGSRPTASLIADLLTVAGPFVVVGIGIAAANTVRFGSPTEFGFGLQLSVWDMTTYPRGRLSYLAPNLLDHVAAIPGHRSSFPWITLRPTIGGDRPSVHTSEPMIGLIFSAPVLVVGAVAALPSGGAPWARARGLGTAVAAAATTGALLLVLVSWPFNTSSLRYTADGAPLLLLAAAGAWLTVRSDAPLASGTGAGTGGRRLDRAWLVALAVGIAVTAAVQVPT